MPKREETLSINLYGIRLSFRVKIQKHFRNFQIIIGYRSNWQTFAIRFHAIRFQAIDDLLKRIFCLLTLINFSLHVNSDNNPFISLFSERLLIFVQMEWKVSANDFVSLNLNPSSPTSLNKYLAKM